MKKWIAAVIVTAVVVALAWRWTTGGSATPYGELPVPGERIPYAVEVLNATDIDGLARVMTRRLRHAGIDVVSFGSAESRGLDSTLVLVRRGDSASGLAVRKALGFGRVLLQADSTLLLDVTVVLGRDAAPLDRNP